MRQNKYTPSINIIRDTNREVTYIPTPNSKQVVHQILSNFRTGIRSFNIIGSYGTGKSSFLLALEQSIKGVKPYFNLSFIKGQDFGIIKLVGSYRSIIESFANQLEIDEDENVIELIFTELINIYKNLGRQPLLFIVIDEFGKFLEYAAQHNSERELYFVQQLAEFVNDTNFNVVLLTTIHQNFESYSYTLTNSQRQEWSKVKGRFKEITFNEPVEQLLYLASEHIADVGTFDVDENHLASSYTLFKRSKSFNFSEYFSKSLNKKIYPLELISASTLTLALQRYGQNERSLFSFLESTDHTSLGHHQINQDPFYNLANVYDYLHFNFYSYLTSRYNVDFASWASIKSSLEIVEREFDDNLSSYSKLIKAIGLLNIFAASGAVLDNKFWIEYGSNVLGIRSAEELLKSLESKKIILYRNFSNRYVLFEGTDLDIYAAIQEAEDKVSEITDVKTALSEYISLPPVLAKSESYKRGTPRLFEFIISDFPINAVPKGEVDGFVNLIFNENLNTTELQKASSNQEEAILYAYYQNSASIKKLLEDIERSKKVLLNNYNDRVAKRELELIIAHQTKLLNHYLVDSLYNEGSEIAWYWNGKDVQISSKRKFNSYLSKICQEVYKNAPHFRNELVNKHKISASIHTAKRNYFRALVNNWDKPQLGFNINKFPPEKTIYLTLLENNGIELFSSNLNHEVRVNTENNFHHLWNASIDFLNSTKSYRRRVSELVDILGKRPFKLKQGLIDFWLPSLLFINRDDFALFGEDGYIPDLNEEILELVVKHPHKYEIKAFDVEGLKLDVFNSYRSFLQQCSKDRLSNASFIETIKPFLNFYKNLPEYSKNTTRLSNEALKVREVIANSQDPESTFFEGFPIALNYSLERIKVSELDLEDYVNVLQDAVRELRTSFEELLNRVEIFLQNEIIGKKVPFDAYKAILQKRFKHLKRHLLLPKQKSFIQRVDSQLDDRKAWLNSISQATIGKTFERISDEEEFVFYDKFKAIILELDSLTSLSKTDYSEDEEDIIGLEISAFFNQVSKKIIRVPKIRKGEVKLTEESIRKTLSTDRTLNIIALTNILKEIIEE